MFVDETSAETSTAPAQGYAPRGGRLVGAVPFGGWETATFVGALSARGFAAPLVIDGAVTGALFRAWVEQRLAPELRRGAVVVVDNLPAHKVAGVREAIERAGARLLYPLPYSPDLNPIELAFSKLKRLLRRAAERSREALWDRIGVLIDRFAPSECRNYFRHCGYRRRPT